MDEEKSPREQGGDDLREKLERLHEELGRTRNVDEETRELLESLMEDTRNLLDKDTGEISPHHESLNERLAAELARFEGTHPELALVMAKVIDTLSGLGI